jgi:hypothetical protein
MSSNLNYKQVANVSRRTWDTEAYEKRAKERANDADSSKKGKSAAAAAAPGEKRPMEEDESNKEEFTAADKGAAGPLKSQRAFLKARRNKVDVDSKVGSVEIVNPEAAATTKAFAGETGSSKVCNPCLYFVSELEMTWLRESKLLFPIIIGWSDKNGHRMALQSL